MAISPGERPGWRARSARARRGSDSPLLALCEALAQGYEHGGKPRSHHPWSPPTFHSPQRSRSRCLGARFPKLFVYEHLVREPVVHRPRPLTSADRHLAQLLEEAPAVALEVERLVGTMAGMAVRPMRDPCTRRQRALVVGIDIGDVHADVLGLDAGTLRADRALGAVRADPDHAVAELNQCVVDRAVLAHEPRGRDLAEPERALQERERGADVLVRKLGNDRRPPPGRDLALDCRHEHCLSSVEGRRPERGLAPQLLREIQRFHRDLTLLFPTGPSSSRRCARALLSRERTVPIGSSSASATLW